MKIRIITRYNAKFDLESKFIIYKQILNNIILTFKYET